MISSLAIDERLTRHFDMTFPDDAATKRLGRTFCRTGYVKLRQLVPDEIRAMVHEEVKRLFTEAHRIDIRLPATGDTPRKMSTVGARRIAERGRVIPAIYDSEPLQRLLGRITGEPLFSCPWEGERYVITRQERSGDTHGWHWDDYAFSLIWVVEAPEGPGGTLQCVPDTVWDKENPEVERYLADREVFSYPHVAGDLYFLRSDTTLHRTIPLTTDAPRTILNTSWASEEDLAKSKSHETMEAMFM